MVQLLCNLTDSQVLRICVYIILGRSIKRGSAVKIATNLETGLWVVVSS